jgi:hypothetical protein
VFEIWYVLRERAAYGSPRAQVVDRRAQALLGQLVFINFFVLLFPLVVVNYYFTYGAPLWLLVSEITLSLIALSVHVYIYWQLKLRPLPKIDNADSLIGLGLFEDVTQYIKVKLQRAWALSLASILPAIGVIPGSLAIVHTSQVLYLIATVGMDVKYRRSALWARRLAVLLLVCQAMIAGFLPLFIYILNSRHGA